MQGSHKFARLGTILRAARTKDSGGHPANDRERIHVTDHYGTGGDYGPSADGHALENRCTMANPDIVTYGDGSGGYPLCVHRDIYPFIAMVRVTDRNGLRDHHIASYFDAVVATHDAIFPEKAVFTQGNTPGTLDDRSTADAVVTHRYNPKAAAARLRVPGEWPDDDPRAEAARSHEIELPSKACLEESFSQPVDYL